MTVLLNILPLLFLAAALITVLVRGKMPLRGAAGALAAGLIAFIAMLFAYRQALIGLSPLPQSMEIKWLALEFFDMPRLIFTDAFTLTVTAALACTVMLFLFFLSGSEYETRWRYGDFATALFAAAALLFIPSCASLLWLAAAMGLLSAAAGMRLLSVRAEDLRGQGLALIAGDTLLACAAFFALIIFGTARLGQLAEQAQLTQLAELHATVFCGLGAAALYMKAGLPPFGAPGARALESKNPAAHFVQYAIFSAVLMAAWKLQPAAANSPSAQQIFFWTGAAGSVLAALAALCSGRFSATVALIAAGQTALACASTGFAHAGAMRLALTSLPFCCALLLMAASSVKMHTHSDSLTDMAQTRPALPVTRLAFITVTLCISAIPPLGGFFWQARLTDMALALGPAQAATVLAAIFLNAAAAGRLFSILFMTETDNPRPKAHEPFFQAAPLILAGTICVFAGGAFAFHDIADVLASAEPFKSSGYRAALLAAIAGASGVAATLAGLYFYSHKELCGGFSIWRKTDEAAENTAGFISDVCTDTEKAAGERLGDVTELVRKATALPDNLTAAAAFLLRKTAGALASALRVGRAATEEYAAPAAVAALFLLLLISAVKYG